MKKKISFLSILIFVLFLKPAISQEKDVLSITLEDSILKALKNNLNIAVEVYNPDIADESVTQAKEIFMPRLDLTYGNDHSESPPYWWIQGAGIIVTKYQDYSATLVQQIPTGGNFSLSLTGYKSKTNQAFQLLDPRYGGTLQLNLTQPLLKNFGFKVSRKEIILAKNNLEISYSQLKSVLLETIYQVEEAYWNLVYAIEDYKVKQQSLQLARDLLAKNKKEVEVGQLAPLEILNSEAAVASREADILQAEALIRRCEDVLKSIINLSREEGGQLKKVAPLDKPRFEKKDISLDAALAEAYEKRPDLGMTRKSIETNQLNVSVARNQMLPGLDLQLSYSSPGISGDRLIYAGNNAFSGVVIGKEKGDSSKALRDALKFLYDNWTVAVTLSLPLSNFLTRAEYARARLELDQNLAKLKTQEQQVYLEVSDAVRSIETDAKRVDAYRIARELAEKRLEAEEKKLNVGLTINYFVLQYQEELANARSMEIKALVDYNLSLAKLEKAMGTSLESRNIKLTEFTTK
jgi:outer membrane protein TolC